MDNDTTGTTAAVPAPVTPGPVTAGVTGDERLTALENRVEEVERVLTWARERFEGFAAGPGAKILATLGFKL